MFRPLPSDGFFERCRWFREIGTNLIGRTQSCAAGVVLSPSPGSERPWQVSRIGWGRFFVQAPLERPRPLPIIVEISEADHGSLAQTQSDGFPIPRLSYRLDGRVGGTRRDAGCSFDSRARVSALSAGQHGRPVLHRCHGRINDGSEDQRTHLRSLQRHGLPGDQAACTARTQNLSRQMRVVRRQGQDHGRLNPDCVAETETLKTWCRLRGLNSRPSVYKTAALPLS